MNGQINKLRKWFIPDTSNSPLLENSIAFTHPKWHDKSFLYKFLAACRRLLKNWDLTAGMSPYSLLFIYGKGLAIFAIFTTKPPFSDKRNFFLFFPAMIDRSAVFLFLKTFNVPCPMTVLSTYSSSVSPTPVYCDVSTS